MAVSRAYWPIRLGPPPARERASFNTSFALLRKASSCSLEVLSDVLSSSSKVSAKRETSSLTSLCRSSFSAFVNICFSLSAKDDLTVDYPIASCRTVAVAEALSAAQWRVERGRSQGRKRAQRPRLLACSG